MNSSENKIQEWAETMPFDQLNKDQQDFVLQTMQEEEYASLYGSNMAFTAFLKEEKEAILPLNSSLETLKAEIEKKRNTNFIVGIWSKQVPLYMAVAACLFFLLVSFAFLYKSEKKEMPLAYEQEPILKLVHDTIFLEKPVLETVVRTVYITKSEQKKSLRTSTPTLSDESSFQKEITQTPDAKGIKKAFGNSPVDMASLEQFKVRL